MISPVLPVYARAPISVARGEGPWLYDENDVRYLDFGAGIAVNALGHAHPVLVAALEAQARRLWHTSNLYRVPGQEKLARMLVAATFADTVFFTNSGAEAMECCIKMARKHFSHGGQPERCRIITFEGAFHGRTMATIAAAGQKKLVNGFGPMLEGFDHAPFGDMAAVEALIGPRTAAIMIEPIQGEGGVRPVPAEDLRALRRICDAHGLLLIFDEIQCGVGRTGKLFAHEWAGVAPDVMGIAKGIGGGFPLGACLAREAAADGMTIGAHGSTYGGNPLAMAVGAALLETVLADGFLDNVSRMAGLLRRRLSEMKDAYPDVIESIRGEGLMIGIKCASQNLDLLNAARDLRLLLVPAGDNVVRILPPLNIDETHATAAMTALEAACAAVRAKTAAK